MSEAIIEERNCKPNGNVINEAEVEVQQPQPQVEPQQERVENGNANQRESEIESDTIDYIDATLKIVEAFESDATLEKIGNGNGKAKKKTVSFNPNDEKIRKFTTGEPIVDQKNPFRNGHIAGGGGREKKTPPPVPTKRSTLSIRKTVTQQLREREREREKEREREREREREQQKNETNLRKKNGKGQPAAAEEYITTEEVLKQSKYVKTYIKNPDAYFVYDPTVLARLKCEEEQLQQQQKEKEREKEKEIPKRKQTGLNRYKEPKAIKQPKLNHNPKSFKKCSKPNYPELANIKIRTGTADAEGDLFNAAEVTKNAKKFDERVKKLQISSDDDLDEIDGPLTKSESSDDLSQPTTNGNQVETLPLPPQNMSNSQQESTIPKDHEPPSTFTNTISSEEFQAYLERKGLALMPKRELGATPSPTASPMASPSPSLLRTPEERRQQVAESLAALRQSNTKKLSVLQRLSNSLFAPKRKTTPKPVMPMPRSVYGQGQGQEEYRKASGGDVPTEMRRILLERQSHQNQNQNGRLPNGQAKANSAMRPASEYTNGHALQNGVAAGAPFQRTIERQSLIPRRVSPESQSASRFQRSASMDRSQIRAQSQRNQPSRLEAVGQRRSLASSAYVPPASDEQLKPVATSTPQRKMPVQESNQQQQANSGHQNDWEKLKAIKEVTDRQLYHKVLQQQQQQGQQQGQGQQQQQQQVQQQQGQRQQQRQRESQENIYEHLQPNQLQPLQQQQQFVRGSLQRNTFSGISGRNRQVMILDGTPIIPVQQMQQQPQPQQQAPPPRCQSVLDNMIQQASPNQMHQVRRGYESESEATPSDTAAAAGGGDASLEQCLEPPHWGLLTREEILEKVKEFCRKSISRTPLPAAKMQPIYESRSQSQSQRSPAAASLTAADTSPVSYASVETGSHKRSASQLSAAAARPQVPLRVQSLPQSRFVPVSAAASPIYAHVNKRSSLLSNDSEQYLSSQQLPQLMRLTPTEYVLVETGEGLQAAKLVDYHHNSLYMQPQFVARTAAGQGQGQGQGSYVLQDGRATPLILERAPSGHQSQIYWTPQHHQQLQLQHQQQQQQHMIQQHLQQQQQQQRLLTMPMSPRGYPVPAPRLSLPMGAKGMVPTPRSLTLQRVQTRSSPQGRHASSEWELSSEAGEVRRIMEKNL